MAEFRFRLQQVIALRERERDEAVAAYRKANDAIAQLHSEIEDLRQEAAGQTPLQSTLGQGSVNAQRLLESQRYQMFIYRQIGELQDKVKLIEAEREKRRLVLVTREQALKSIEKVREKQRRDWQDAQERAAQTALDEWASTKHWQAQQKVADK